MLYREIIAVCSQIHTEHTKHTNTLCGQNESFFSLNAQPVAAVAVAIGPHEGNSALLSLDSALLSQDSALLSQDSALLSQDSALLSLDSALLSLDSALL